MLIIYVVNFLFYHLAPYFLSPIFKQDLRSTQYALAGPGANQECESQSYRISVPTQTGMSFWLLKMFHLYLNNHASLTFKKKKRSYSI